VVAASVGEKYLLVMLVLAALMTNAGVLGVAVSYVAASFSRSLLSGAASSPARSRGSRAGRPGLRPAEQPSARPHRRRHERRPEARRPLPARVRGDDRRLLRPRRPHRRNGRAPTGDRGNDALPLPRPSRAQAPGDLISALFGACGAALAAAGVLAAPRLVPFGFGEKYADAVDAVRLMFLAVPLIYAANPLQTYGFSYGREPVRG
jgi:hypothetical protein